MMGPGIVNVLQGFTPSQSKAGFARHVRLERSRARGEMYTAQAHACSMRRLCQEHPRGTIVSASRAIHVKRVQVTVLNVQQELSNHLTGILPATRALKAHIQVQWQQLSVCTAQTRMQLPERAATSSQTVFASQDIFWGKIVRAQRVFLVHSRTPVARNCALSVAWAPTRDNQHRHPAFCVNPIQLLRRAAIVPKIACVFQDILQQMDTRACLALLEHSKPYLVALRALSVKEANTQGQLAFCAQSARLTPRLHTRGARQLSIVNIASEDTLEPLDPALRVNLDRIKM